MVILTRSTLWCLPIEKAHQQQGSSPQPPANAQTAAQPQYDYSQVSIISLATMSGACR